MIYSLTHMVLLLPDYVVILWLFFAFFIFHRHMDTFTNLIYNSENDFTITEGMTEIYKTPEFLTYSLE